MVSYELYLSHLNPLNEFLFQRPKRNPSIYEDVLYDNMVVGERSPGVKMKNLLQEAKLFKCYTSHSIRATAVADFDNSGFEARHIMAVSGHKNEGSIRSYTKTDICTKKKMSETLTTRCKLSEELSNINSHQSLRAYISKELSVMNSHQSSPVLSLSREEIVIRSSRSEITKNFNLTVI